MSDALTSSDQHVLQRRDNRFNVAVVLAGVDMQCVFIKMRVESGWIDVENFALTRQNCEDGLNAMKLLAITEIDVLNQIV